MAGLLCPYVRNSDNAFVMKDWGHLEIMAWLVPSRSLEGTIHFWSSLSAALPGAG